jgi:trimeric autotransporter adhesin
VITRQDRAEVADSLHAVTGSARSAGATVAENARATATGAGQALSSAAGAVSSAVDTATGAVSSAVDTATGAVSSAVDTAAGAVSSAVDTATGAVSSAVSVAGDAVQSVSSAVEAGALALAARGRRARKIAKAEAEARRKQARRQGRKAGKQARKARRRGERALAGAKAQAAERASVAASLVRRQKPATSKKRKAGRVLLIAAQVELGDPGQQPVVEPAATPADGTAGTHGADEGQRPQLTRPAHPRRRLTPGAGSPQAPAEVTSPQARGQFSANWLRASDSSCGSTRV